MKKCFAVLLVIVSLFVYCSASADEEVFWRYTNYGNTGDLVELYDYQQFSIDVFMSTETLKAYIIETVWENYKPMTRTLTAEIKSKVGDSKYLYLVLENDSEIKCHFDDDHYYLWLDYYVGSLRLHPDTDNFIEFFDFLGDK